MGGKKIVGETAQHRSEKARRTTIMLFTEHVHLRSMTLVYVARPGMIPAPRLGGSLAPPSKVPVASRPVAL